MLARRQGARSSSIPRSASARAAHPGSAVQSIEVQIAHTSFTTRQAGASALVAPDRAAALAPPPPLAPLLFSDALDVGPSPLGPSQLPPFLGQRGAPNAVAVIGCERVGQAGSCRVTSPAGVQRHARRGVRARPSSQATTRRRHSFSKPPARPARAHRAAQPLCRSLRRHMPQVPLQSRVSWLTPVLRHDVNP
jgi:hypothetical protein